MQSQNPDDIASLVVAIVIVVGFFGLLFLLDRNQRRTGRLLTGPMTPLKRILALVLALFFGGFTVLEIVSAHSIHFLFPIVALVCLIYALRPSPSIDSTVNAASPAAVESQSDAIPRLDQAAWSNPPGESTPHCSWLPITLIAVGIAGVIALVVGLVAITNQRQTDTEVASLSTPNAGEESQIMETVTPSASKSDPSNVLTYIWNGDAHVAKAEWEEAIADYTKAAELDPTFWGSYRYRGEVYDWMGNYQQALEDFNLAIARNAKNAESYMDPAC